MNLIKLLEFDSSVDIEEFLKKEISLEQQVDIPKEKTVNKGVYIHIYIIIKTNFWIYTNRNTTIY